MDKQFLEIQKRRKHLFEWDVENDRGYAFDLDLELYHVDDFVNWKVNEPDIAPKFGIHHARVGTRYGAPII